MPTRYHATVTPLATPIMANPTGAGTGTTMGISAPITQISWKRVSKRAKERPRLASGASRWTIESKACLAELPVAPTTIDRIDAPSRPPMNAVSTPPTVVTTSAPRRIRSSVRSRRRRGATTAPRKKPSCAVAATTPSCHNGAPAFLNANANMNDRKPTIPRMTAIDVRGQEDARAAQLLALGLALGLGGDRRRRQLERQHGGHGEDDGGQAEGPLGPAETQEDPAGHDGHDHGERRQDGQLRVGLDQLGVAAHRAGTTALLEIV